MYVLYTQFLLKRYLFVLNTEIDIPCFSISHLYLSFICVLYCAFIIPCTVNIVLLTEIILTNRHDFKRKGHCVYNYLSSFQIFK